MKIINSFSWFEVLVIGSLLLMVILWNVVPIVVKGRMKRAGLNRPVSLYRRNIRIGYKQRKKSDWKTFKQFIDKNMTDEGADVFALIIAILIFGIIALLLLWAKAIPLLVVLGYCIWRLVFSYKLLFARCLPAYVAFQGAEIGVLIGGSLLSPDGLMRELNEKMVRPESAIEFLTLQPIAVKVIAHEEAILNAGVLLSDNSLDKKEREELGGKLETLIGLLKRRKREISESGDIWLHMTGKQLHTGFNTFVESEMQEELGKTNVLSKETPMIEERSQPINPAIDDLLKIANDTKIDQATRTLAKETIKEIERKLLGEELRSEHETTQLSAMASIITARNMYDLGEPKTPVE